MGKKYQGIKLEGKYTDIYPELVLRLSSEEVLEDGVPYKLRTQEEYSIKVDLFRCPSTRDEDETVFKFPFAKSNSSLHIRLDDKTSEIWTSVIKYSAPHDPEYTKQYELNLSSQETLQLERDLKQLLFEVDRRKNAVQHLGTLCTDLNIVKKEENIFLSINYDNVHKPVYTYEIQGEEIYQEYLKKIEVPILYRILSVEVAEDRLNYERIGHPRIKLICDVVTITLTYAANNMFDEPVIYIRVKGHDKGFNFHYPNTAEFAKLEEKIKEYFFDVKD